MTQKLLPYNIVILSLNPSYNDVPFPGSMVAKASALFFFLEYVRARYLGIFW
jgi:hypothetical protein